MTPILQLRNVAFEYPGRPILQHTSFSLTKGSCIALVGPNGVGKTTLLRIASGFLKPTAGEVLFDNKPLSAATNRHRARLIALVPQQLDVPFDFTVRQIVGQGRTPYLGFLRGPLREDRLAVDRALDLTDLSSLTDRVFNELSGGERQRVKIALALAQEPKLLLLDEPTQNLDIGRQVELIDLLHSLRNEGLTIFASIHDLHLIHGNFSEVHLLSPNSTLMSGHPIEVLTPSRLAEAFHCPPGRHPLLMNESATRGERLSS
jgi:iron complex transport system ATP-binding protein